MFICAKCSKQYVWPYDLVRHLHAKHSDEDQQVTNSYISPPPQQQQQQVTSYIQPSQQQQVISYLQQQQQISNSYMLPSHQPAPQVPTQVLRQMERETFKYSLSSIAVVVGPSGCGKTMLVYIILLN